MNSKMKKKYINKTYSCSRKENNANISKTFCQNQHYPFVAFLEEHLCRVV